jgi:hypothetical protein
MSEWTETARKTLNEYCARSRQLLEGTGADADEVIEDLRRHVDEEIRASGLSVVTDDAIRRILAKVGEPAVSEATRSAQAAKEAASPAPASLQKPRPGYFILFSAVILPVITIVFELVTGFSSGLLFDPMPTWLHVLILSLVPVSNAWVWRAARRQDSRSARLLSWLNGAACGICLYYALLYLPFTPFAGIGLIFFGMGLLPLSPLIASIATPLLRGAFQKQIPSVRLSGGFRGMLSAVGLLVLLQVPTAITYYGLANAVSNEKETQIEGVRVLRHFGDDDLMLRACYGLLQRDLDMDVVRSIAGGNKYISPDQAREIYYRVAGKPFNSVPPPALYTRAGRWRALDEEWTWDDALGGELVAGRVKGLSLLSSRMDAVADPDSALVYCEWTVEFKNVSPQQREARAQIALPPGAVVSRLTLWINGEEREAAFGGRAQVREAYKEVAVVQRHDPVLVTTCGPDRILMQCFPVQPNGGIMKVRLGITAPLSLDSLDKGYFPWPHFLERNFHVAPDFKHTLVAESSLPLSGGYGAATLAKSETHPFMLREMATEVSLENSPKSIVVQRSSGVTNAWESLADGKIVRQIIRPAPATIPSRLVIVVDGSVGMKKFIHEVVAAISEIPDTTEIAVVLAGDGVRFLTERPQKISALDAKEIQRIFNRVECAGGQDNLPALEDAWNLAAGVEKGAVLWIHQPQAVLLSSESTLRQCIERRATPTRLFEVQAGIGPDRLVEKLDGLSAVDHVPRHGSLSEDLRTLFAQWSGKSQRFEMIRERLTASPEVQTGPEAGKHLERLWARDESLRLNAKHQAEAATKLAAEHQLVTPLTGAVVLETLQQYAQNGLKAADPTTVPSVPEPQTFTLLGVGIGVYVLFRVKRRRSSREVARIRRDE